MGMCMRLGVDLVLVFTDMETFFPSVPAHGIRCGSPLCRCAGGREGVDDGVVHGRMRAVRLGAWAVRGERI